ncbi:MAG: hypothetical protein DKM50_02640 [Candidatus Margulisiibacteriota bacterium]|nr:MAG: hypothetical protein DKM50_02640 [Candidatus Margulisiibacteriota bacterium]HAR62505.1 hypothetical protein [Candidatus Margulisiibacteriota bacterium]HCT86333.1 hypothetical protein [Candidatus Margulisiibacteriota bacterium]HCY38130.1 hypothetical protein [Candidatus Margulisiibacteriota bacterium]
MRNRIKSYLKYIPFLAPLLRIPGIIISSLKNYVFYLNSFIRFRVMDDKRFPVSWNQRMVILVDRTDSTGFDHHYIYHLAWAARKLSNIMPRLHIDISSSIYFMSLISAFIPVHFYDYRPAKIKLSELDAKAGDVTKLPFPDKSVESLSCMHVVEHVGLGRYGDPLDPQGDLKSISELKRVLDVNGTLLFVVPVGIPRIQYNAHRIYSYDQIINYFEGMDLIEFSLITDNPEDGLIEHADPELANRQQYGCGCFYFTKKTG